MGLSDGERYVGVAHTISRLAKMERFKNHDGLSWGNGDHPISDFNRLLDKLWPTFIGGKNNSLHWFMGGELSSNMMGECSLLRAAFEGVKEDLFEDSPNKTDSSERKAEFELEKYLEEFRPSPMTLMSGNKLKVFTIYAESEGYYYRTNRYHDKFAKGLKKTTKIMSQLVGLCFDEFKQDSNYMLAWMMGHMFHDVILPSWTENDFLVKMFKEFHLHHNIRLPETIEYKKKVYDTFVDWQSRQRSIKEPSDKYQLERDPNRDIPITTDERMKFVLSMFEEKGKFEYVHQHKKLFEMIKANNAALFPEKKEGTPIGSEFIDILWVKDTCSRLVKINEERKKADMNGYRTYCHLTGQEI